MIQNRIQFQNNHGKTRRIKDTMDTQGEEEKRSYKLSDGVSMSISIIGPRSCGSDTVCRIHQNNIFDAYWTPDWACLNVKNTAVITTCHRRLQTVKLFAACAAIRLILYVGRLEDISLTLSATSAFIRASLGFLVYDT